MLLGCGCLLALGARVAPRLVEYDAKKAQLEE